MNKLHALTLAVAAAGLSTAALAEGYNKDAQSSTSNGQMESSASVSIDTGAALDAAQVRDIQTSLRDDGHSVSVDGVWGAQTTAALRDFQQANGLNATGEINSETMAALDLDSTSGQ